VEFDADITLTLLIEVALMIAHSDDGEQLQWGGRP